MEIKIYQINMDKDRHGVAFESLDRTFRYQGSSDVDSGIYGLVYEGKVEASDLEDIYRLFNWIDFERPDDFYGHSLSVSDVVGIKDPQTQEWTYHFCDIFGFKEISFDEAAAENI